MDFRSKGYHRRPHERLLNKVMELVMVGMISILLTLFFSSVVMATEFTSPATKDTITQDTNVQGKFYFLSDTYVTPITSESDLNSSKLFSLDLSLKGDRESWAAQGNFQSGHYSEVNNSYFATRELYYEYKLQKKFISIYLGRKFERWSALEQTWGLSLWEPQFVLDALRPIPQGLSGLSFRVQQDNLSITTFVSTIYIPNMGPEIKPNAEGQIKVNNRWIKPPNREFPFNGKSTQILYSLDLPSVAEIINQKSVAVVSQLGDVQAGPWASLALARKPVNELVLSYQGVLRLRDEGSYGDVKIVPHVISHDIANLDLGYQWQSQALMVSYLRETPFNPAPLPGWNYQQFEAIEASSIKWDWTLYSYLGEQAKLSLGRLYLQGGHIYELDGEGQDSHVMDGMRIRFTDAWAINFETPILGGSRALLSSKIHFVRDIAEQGSLINAEFYLKPSTDFSLVLGADIIGVRDNSDNNKSKTFLNQNRANDRAYAGVSYVF